jgi:hypothetical protein
MKLERERLEREKKEMGELFRPVMNKPAKIESIAEGKSRLCSFTWLPFVV